MNKNTISLLILIILLLLTLWQTIQWGLFSWFENKDILEKESLKILKSSEVGDRKCSNLLSAFANQPIWSIITLISFAAIFMLTAILTTLTILVYDIELNSKNILFITLCFMIGLFVSFIVNYKGYTTIIWHNIYPLEAKTVY